MTTAGSSQRASALPPMTEPSGEPAAVPFDGPAPVAELTTAREPAPIIEPAPVGEPAVDASGGILAADPDDRTVISQRPPLSPAGAARPMPSLELGKLLAGERLNHFELLEYVGGGGMGAVFRALDTMLNREVALKVLSRDQGADEETRRRFQNEAQSAARLDHENIARVFYVGEDKGLNYIVFEFIEGVNLREYVEQKGPLPLAETISYTLQVADALAHASSRDVVHRDIKPSNVIITADGRAKLVDMGLARLHQVQPDGEDLTASGVTLGTFDYISPEQARDPRIADVRSDIYSLGCTVYFMLTGRPPFPDGTVLQKLLQHNSDEPPDPRELNPELPEDLSLVIRKMLAKDPRRRYQHPSELTVELYRLAEQIGCPTPGSGRLGGWVPAPAPPRVSALQRHLPWIIPVAALLALVAILDRWQIDEPSEAQQTDGQTQTALTGKSVALVSRGPSAVEQGGSADKPRPAAIDASEGRQQSRSTPPDADSNRSPAAKESARGDDKPDNSTSGTPRESSSQPNSAQTKSDDDAGAGSANAADASVAKRSDEENAQANGAKTEGANSSPPAEDTEPAKPAELEELPPGLLVVGDEQGPQRFATLSAACAAAKSGDVIELRYSGPRQEIPISLANLRLFIRAKEPHQPVVAFTPNKADPQAFPHSMLRIVGGSLRLSNVGFVLHLPRSDPSENWTLFEAQLAESFDLEKCTLTIENASEQGGAYHDKVSFFHLKSSPGAEAMMPKGMMSIPPLEIRLQDCLVRGEATFLRDDDAQPVRVQWRNGLLACSEWLLSAAGATTMQSPSSGESGKIHLSLEHLTMALGGGLCRMTNGYSMPVLLDVDVQLRDSVAIGATERAHLIEQDCIDSLADLQRRLSWKGDRNIYGNFAAFWRMDDLNSIPLRAAMSFEDWREHWGQLREVQSSNAPLVWKRRPSAGQPFHSRTAADYVIDDSAENAYAFDTTDGEMVGVNAAALPSVAAGRDAADAASSGVPPVE